MYKKVFVFAQNYKQCLKKNLNSKAKQDYFPCLIRKTNTIHEFFQETT